MLAKGDVCPACGKGKLYKYEPAVTVRISGNSPLTSTKHIREKLRCNGCLQYFSAPLPKEVIEDGGEDNLYTYSARAIMQYTGILVVCLCIVRKVLTIYCELR